MILYFAGGHQEMFHEYIRKGGGEFLLSYVNDYKRLIKFFEQGEKGFFVDSGAFSAHRRGISIDVDKYIEFLNMYDDHIRIAAQLDTIPGRFGEVKTSDQLEEAPRLSWENYLYMVPKLKSPEKLLPVFHQGEGFEWLDQILAYEPKVQYMGVSPSNDRTEAEKEAWLREVYRVIKLSSNPNIQTHALGMTNMRLMESFPLTSADSTTWLMNGVYGNITTRFGILSISERKKVQKGRHLLNQPQAIQQEVINDIEKFGYTLEELSGDSKKRALYNVDFFLDWAKNYEYKPEKTGARKLFR